MLRILTMLFGKGDHRKKGGGGGILRLFLSLIIMAILGLGLLQAFRSFSGTDPLTLDPKTSLKSLMSSEGAYNFIVGLLTASPDKTLDKAKQLLGQESDQNSSNSYSSGSIDRPEGSELFKFAIIADSHKDTPNLLKALNQAKASGAKFVIGIGDFSDVGTVEELTNTKTQFDASGLSYYLVPGDHDLWDSRNKSLSPTQNFMTVFQKPTYQSFSYQNTRFILSDNSDNYIGLDGLQLNWLEEELNRVQSDSANLILAVVDIPLYHPSSDHIMGKTSPKLKNQAAHLSSIFKKAGVKEVFAADAHFFSKYKDPTEDLPMTVVGAVTSEKNAQAPRFVLVDVYEDGSYNIEDTEIR